MKVISRGHMPDGTRVQIENWAKVDDKHPLSSPPTEYVLGLYPVAKRNSPNGWIKAGDEFRVTICDIPNTNDDYPYFQAIFKAFLNLNRGTATILDFKENILDWDKVKNLLEGEDNEE